MPAAVRSGVCRTSAPFLLIVALLALPVSIARADGDPASDYLIANQVFLTSQSATVSPAQRQLVATVRAANNSGFAVRVAVISSEYDLGSITALWHKPSIYARFLGLELSSAYKQRLVVVMPDGFGFNWPGHPTADAYRLLGAVRMGAGGDGLASAAQAAVRRLASAAGVKLAPIQSGGRSASAKSSGASVLAVVGAAVGGLVVLGAFAAVLPRVRRRRRLARMRTRPRSAERQAVSTRLVWAIPGIAVLLAVAATVGVIAFGRSGTQPSIASVVTPPPFSWPAGTRPAPAFVLHDQAGQPVSVAAYRGRPVIVTFIDPLCRNLCPLEAQVLNQVERQMPAPQRPVVLAVSVDVYAKANSRANLLQTFRRWHLVPQWRWAVGPPAQLASVWKRYEVGVAVVTKRIAGTAIHYITHTEAAYVVDGTGHERALFVWPFYPQDVTRVLRRLA